HPTIGPHSNGTWTAVTSTGRPSPPKAKGFTMKRLILAISLITLPGAALLTALPADANVKARNHQRDVRELRSSPERSERDGRTTQAAQETDNPYPHTSRVEPERKTSDRNM